MDTIRKRLRRDGVMPIVEHRDLGKSVHAKESAIERDILRWLNEEAGFYAIKIPSIGLFDSNVGGFRKRNAFAVNGVSDVIALKGGKVFFIEVKTVKGVQSLDQKKFMSAVRSKGCIYVVVHSVEEMQDFVQEWFGG